MKSEHDQFAGQIGVDMPVHTFDGGYDQSFPIFH
jgi:hypothetical protein